jgi:hypothetical protein
MKNEFISYEQALELKELGFDEPCLAFYNGKFLESTDYNFDNGTSKDIGLCIVAPLYQQAFRWLHEQLDMKGLMPTTDLEYRSQMLNNLIKMLSSKKKKYA